MKRKYIFVFILFAIVIAGLLFFSETSFSQEVCSIFRTYRNNPKSPKLKHMEAEHMIGKICNPKHSRMCEQGDLALSKLFEMGFSEKDQRLNCLLETDSFVWISKVDIDNDGIDEIRLFHTVGSARCTYSYFYRQEGPGQLRLISHPSYAVLSEDARFCGGGLSFKRYQGEVFVLEVYDKIDTVWRGSINGLKQLCNYDKP